VAAGEVWQGALVITRLDVLLPTPLTGRGPSYTCGMIARSMAGAELSVTVVAPHARAHSIAPAEVFEILPHWARYVPYRWIRSLADRKVERAFLSQATRDQVAAQGAYIWPNCSLSTVAKLQREGIKVFREMVNCHRGSAKLILDDAYRRLGLSPCHGIDEESIDAEQQVLEIVDHVFCPNACVEASLLQNGLDGRKILPASYGWNPARFAGTDKLLPPHDGITVVFVGTICVRKGVHLLLDYWAKSKVRGRLVLAGAMEPAIREKCASLLARDDVTVLDYISDVGGLYRSADVFAFPSLEEGGPQVTYEACGCGLPVITTPMGAGRIARDNREGFVLDPYDEAGWVSAFRALAANLELRRNMASAARDRAELFHWHAVAERRKRQILSSLSGHLQTAAIVATGFEDGCGMGFFEKRLADSETAPVQL
jgi:glycosyltransferase involved in cell wall biosynthesis